MADVSDRVSTPGRPDVHSLVPAFLFAGDGDSPGLELHRVYVFSDSDCVNPVHIGSVVGRPAYAPRTRGAARPRPSQARGSADTRVIRAALAPPRPGGTRTTSRVIGSGHALGGG